MPLETIVLLVLKISIVLTIFSVALDARADELVFLLRRPDKLVRSLVAMNVVMPLVALGIVAVFPLQPVVKVALMALSVSPVPPFLPGRVLKMGGSEAYIIGLLAVAALLSIVIAPVVVSLLGLILGIAAHTGVGKIALAVTVSVLAPLVAGVLVRQFWPDLADKAARPISLLATVLLVATGLAGFVASWPLIASLVGEGAVLAFLAFVLIGIAAGHLLGGPEPDDRTVLAFATACRHPGVAIAIVAANFPDPKLAAASVFLYLLVSMIGTTLYTLWRKRHDGNHLHAPAE